MLVEPVRSSGRLPFRWSRVACLTACALSAVLVTTLAQAQATENTIAESREDLQEKLKPKNKRTIGWELEFGSEFMTENRDESLAVLSGFTVDLAFEFSNQLRLVVAPRARIYSARSQERFDSDNFEDRLSMKEAFFEYKPFSALTLQAGTISKFDLGMSQLVSRNRSFPALSAQAFVPAGPVSAIATYEESVPTSYSYNPQRDEKEPLPGLRTLRGQLKFQPIQAVDIELAGGQLSWRNLPAKVAYNSQRLGNTLQGELAPTSRFAYGFQTNFAKVDVFYCATCTLAIKAVYVRSQNALAPSNSADGQGMGVGVAYSTDALITRLVLEDFFSESDLTPAAYAASSFGNTNRRGQRIELEFELPQSELKIKTEWVRATAIAPSPFQNDLNFVYLGVETNGQFLQ